MCFSASASFTATATLTVLGIVTLRQIRSKNELLLGLFPCFFASQQFIEGLVWLSLKYNSLVWLNPTATYSFLLFATGLWLVFSPMAIYFLEDNLGKKKIILGIAGVGVLLGIYLFYSVIIHQVSPQVFSGNLFYDLTFLPQLNFTKYLYVLIICLPFFISSKKVSKLFGLVILASFIFAETYYQLTLVSVWCFFAAIISSTIYFILRYYHSQEEILPTQQAKQIKPRLTEN